ncbi:transcription factor TGA1-like isoform X1 [Trifolium pratense]|uniref:transcription factor TGA1-like isoform X1 n=1 Tax=Trifolium pratense TaxID=57577 RepID=UPI001E69795B|nr:transcription factor TGA1-like isoform X1 [Trifolium pratense]XP_045809555.1 transcription factor TGA1-like isoform X1 [Trifolium pratense]XP_045809621.1 transcription factor TGA1-like isoform X1 [Trifolium pratense]XP_045809622.1 transcription factor TGA1-like isoform X1 [Trifolium pratense]
MNSPSAQFVSSRRMSVYDPIHQINMWGEGFKSNGNLSASIPLIDEVDLKFDSSQSEDASHGILGTSNKYDQEASRPIDKIQRRLAQNREAARKSRLRKKAYVQQLESSRLKLVQLEQELERVRQQGMYMNGGLDSNNMCFAGPMNSGIAAFEMEYGHWVDEQNRQISEMRSALNSHISDIELRILVDGMMNHYAEIYRMKSAAAKADVFYVMSGMWKTTAERFFLWIGGFRPSELLKILGPMIEPLTEQQRLDIDNLGQSCQQAEDALSQGMEKLRQTLADSVAAGQFIEGTYIPQMATAMEKLEALVCFVNQADHLRQETLQQMSRILTIRQSARCLLALGEYFQRLRALSSLWSNRPREPA